MVVGEMVAIFPFFHNGQSPNPVSVDTRRTRDPKFERGVSNLEFFHMIDIYEMVAIFPFFIIADAQIPASGSVQIQKSFYYLRCLVKGLIKHIRPDTVMLTTILRLGYKQ